MLNIVLKSGGTKAENSIKVYKKWYHTLKLFIKNDNLDKYAIHLNNTTWPFCKNKIKRAISINYYYPSPKPIMLDKTVKSS